MSKKRASKVYVVEKSRAKPTPSLLWMGAGFALAAFVASRGKGEGSKTPPPTPEDETKAIEDLKQEQDVALIAEPARATIKQTEKRQKLTKARKAQAKVEAPKKEPTTEQEKLEALRLEQKKDTIDRLTKELERLEDEMALATGVMETETDQTTREKVLYDWSTLYDEHDSKTRLLESLLKGK